MLEFYAPEKKSDAPAIAIDSLEARVDGRVAVVTARLAYSVAGINGQSRTVALRGGFLMKRSGGVWKIAFAQYTPMTTQKH
jgi:ketosteroid isomerase-like protein